MVLTLVHHGSHRYPDQGAFVVTQVPSCHYNGQSESILKDLRLEYSISLTEQVADQNINKLIGRDE